MLTADPATKSWFLGVDGMAGVDPRAEGLAWPACIDGLRTIPVDGIDVAVDGSG